MTSSGKQNVRGRPYVRPAEPLAVLRWRRAAMETTTWWRIRDALRVAVRVHTREEFLRLPGRLRSVLRTRVPAPERPRVLAAPAVARLQGEPDISLSVFEQDVPCPWPGLRVATVVGPWFASRLQPEASCTPLEGDTWNSVVGRSPADGGPHLLVIEDRAGLPGWAPQAARAAAEAGVGVHVWAAGDPSGPAPTDGVPDVLRQVLEHAGHVWATDPVRLEALRSASDGASAGLLLPAVQPRLHHPVRNGDPRDLSVAYAGPVPPDPVTVEHVEPLWDLGLVVLAPERFGPSDPEPTWPPERYLGRVVGPVEVSERAAAVQQFRAVVLPAGSGGSCAQAVELAATGTCVIVPGVPGEPEDQAELGACEGTVLTPADPRQTRSHAAAASGSLEHVERAGVASVRRILAGHTWGHRVVDLARAQGLDLAGPEFAGPESAGTAAAGGRAVRRPVPGRAAPAVSVVVPTCRADLLDEVLRTHAGLAYANRELVVVAHGFPVVPQEVAARAAELGVERVRVLSAPVSDRLGDVLNRGIAAAEGDFVAKMDDDDYYGPEYLSDQVAAFGYTRAEIVGKLARYWYFAGSGATILQWKDREHRYVSRLAGGTLLMTRDLARAYPFGSKGSGEDSDLLRRLHGDGVAIYGTDRFNYCMMRRADPGFHTWQQDEADLLSNGGIVEFYGDPRAHVTV
ncbi:MAG: hypothetical protein QG608_460 [Actinomycetota bacterium]|nr:hypothetical protein [Actinomycetota bacterium]